MVYELRNRKTHPQWKNYSLNENKLNHENKNT